MRQPATLAPDGGIPTDCTDACLEEQALTEPYNDSIAHLLMARPLRRKSATCAPTGKVKRSPKRR